MIEPLSFTLVLLGATILVTSITASKFVSEQNKHHRINYIRQIRKSNKKK